MAQLVVTSHLPMMMSHLADDVTVIDDDDTPGDVMSHLVM